MGQRLERSAWAVVGEERPNVGPSLAETKELEHDARLEELLRHRSPFAASHLLSPVHAAAPPAFPIYTDTTD